MGVPNLQFVSLVLAACLAGCAPTCYSQTGSEAASQAIPAAAVQTSGKVKRPSIQFNLTDSHASLKASLWAVHVLRTASREQVMPAEIQNSSGFAVTGPFAERSAGIRLEYAF
jgi:hypothetical protein